MAALHSLQRGLRLVNNGWRPVLQRASASSKALNKSTSSPGDCLDRTKLHHFQPGRWHHSATAAAVSKGVPGRVRAFATAPAAAAAAVDSPPRPRYALVRGVPDSYASALTRGLPQAVSLELAREQHAAYVESLRGLVGELVELPADERFPDCPFVEDTAIVVEDRAFITRIGADSRVGEEVAVRSVLQELGLKIIDAPPGARIDGGDVLLLHGHLFVGLSSRTNSAGVRAVTAAFPNVKVVPVPLPPESGGLHLKSVLSWVGGTIVAVETNSGASKAFENIHVALPDLQALTIIGEGAANTVLVGDTLLFPAALLSSEGALRYQTLGRPTIPITATEFHKRDGGLTCLSILIP